MYFDYTPKHMIRLSVEYRQDSKIPIRLWKSLVGETPSCYITSFVDEEYEKALSKEFSFKRNLFIKNVRSVILTFYTQINLFSAGPRYALSYIDKPEDIMTTMK